MKKILLIAALLLVAVALWYTRALRPVDPASTDRIAVTVEPGMAVKDIAIRLYEKNIIRAPFAFIVRVKLGGDEQSLQAGKFVIGPSMWVHEIVDVLKNGKAEEMIITIPEGFTVKDIDALLTEKNIIEGGEIIDCAQNCDFSSFEFLPDPSSLAERGGKLEGYLFPDTYYIAISEFVPKFFLERLMTTFRHRVFEQLPSDFDESGRTLHEIITMASLIEEETRTDDERSIVSGILWKRYDAGLGLGVDATVRYILDKPTDAITIADLNTNSAYNTRKFKGLPPGPIASPGEKSILAALHPEQSEYWYYLHGDDGQIRYAVTNEEHNINKYRFIE